MHEMSLRTVTAIPLVLFFSALVIYGPTYLFVVTALIVLYVMLAYELPRLLRVPTPYYQLISIVYPILPTILIISIHLSTGPLVTTYLMCSVALFDTASYFVGKAWGTIKLLPKISPGKSLQGFVGGSLAVTLFNLIFLNNSTNWTFILFFTIALCILAFAGDVFESALKRKVGLKDSGSLLPGHGGIFDRLDGLLFVVFLVFAYKDYIKELLSF